MLLWNLPNTGNEGLRCNLAYVDQAFVGGVCWEFLEYGFFGNILCCISWTSSRNWQIRRVVNEVIRDPWIKAGWLTKTLNSPSKKPLAYPEHRRHILVCLHQVCKIAGWPWNNDSFYMNDFWCYLSLRIISLVCRSFKLCPRMARTRLSYNLPLVPAEIITVTDGIVSVGKTKQFSNHIHSY